MHNSCLVLEMGDGDVAEDVDKLIKSNIVLVFEKFALQCAMPALHKVVGVHGAIIFPLSICTHPSLLLVVFEPLLFKVLPEPWLCRFPVIHQHL